MAFKDSLAKLSTAGKIILGLGTVIIAAFILWGAYQLAKLVPPIGEIATSTPISAPAWLNSIIRTVLIGDVAPLTLESIVLFLAIFVIIFFAISDILEAFSTFSPAVAWSIGFGIALIAGVTKVVATVGGLFGLAAGIGAFGILLIILGALGAAVTLNLGIGGPVRKWRLMRQAEIEGMKAEKGAGRVKSAIGALKEVEGAFGKGEKV